MRVQAGDGEIADAVRRWLRGLEDAKYELAVLEGLPCAGKSTIVKHLVPNLPCWIVELDDLLLRPEPDQSRTWVEAVIARGALKSISKEAEHGLTLVEGPAAWPVARTWIKETGRTVRVSRAYLKAVTVLNGYTFWDAGDGLRERARRHERFMASIYEYHADEEPWETADIVFERCSV